MASTLPTEDAARKELQLWTFLTEYFPDSFVEVVKVAVAGNRQHNPGQPLHWAKGKSTDQMNTAFRHQWDHKMGTAKDVDGCYHLAKAIWRLSAELQLTIEKERDLTVTAQRSEAEVAFHKRHDDRRFNAPNQVKIYGSGDEATGD